VKDNSVLQPDHEKLSIAESSVGQIAQFFGQIAQFFGQIAHRKNKDV
jgi:hypothetical protein